MKDQIEELNRKFKDAAVPDLLNWFTENYPDRIAFSTSLGAEDQVIMHFLSKIRTPVKIFTLDTGRLFQETYDLLDITRKKYGLPIDIYFPDARRVEGMVRAKGINLFYESVENRQMCCGIRKIEPLIRALTGMEVWITGMRKEQSVTRTGADLVEWDPEYGIIKLNPLVNWTLDMVWHHVRTFGIPVNELHSKGFPSIGCLPCTRAVKPGEDLRSGRWWWEMPENKECGLHKNSTEIN
jgi:phosphoadenosine phosphosulfate reductase